MNEEQFSPIEHSPGDTGGNLNPPSAGKGSLFNANIRGRTVISADGQAVGRVDDVVVNIDTWRVESVHLKLNKGVADKLGVHRGKLQAGTIDLPVHMVQSVGDHVVLSVPTSELRPRLQRPNNRAA
jgi:sporulation protein YlmC with PRC-barrel domain